MNTKAIGLLLFWGVLAMTLVVGVNLLVNQVHDMVLNYINS